MRVLFTSPILEHPPAGGGQLRVENSIKALSTLCELDIISRSPPAMSGGEQAEAFYKGLCQEFHVMPMVRGLSSNRYIRKIQRISGNIGGRNLRQEGNYILNHLERRNINIIWFGYGNISYPLIRYIKKKRPDIITICDTDSVWSRFILRELPYAKGLRRLFIRWAGAQKIREEKAWVGLCDFTTAVSEIDADYYRSMTRDPSRIKVFSNVIDVDYYSSPPGPPLDLRHPCIYLAGTYGRYNSPMDVAARWILEEILPRVRTHIPDVHFYIVGKDSNRMYGHLRDPNITVTGKVPTVLPYLCHVDVALVPLHFESGTRFKILEAGACHIPLVSTTLGAEGIPVQHGKHLLIADSPDDFAAAIITLLTDRELAKKMANTCSELVRMQYSIEALRKEAEVIFSAIKEKTK